MLHKLVAATAVAIGVVLGSTASPSFADHTSCTSSSPGWSHSGNGGSTWGSCDVSGSRVTRASGYVKDTVADGYCIQAIVDWYNGSTRVDTDYSALACPKGEVEDFVMLPGDGTLKTATKAVISMRRV